MSPFKFTQCYPVPIPILNFFGLSSYVAPVNKFALVKEEVVNFAFEYEFQEEKCADKETSTEYSENEYNSSDSFESTENSRSTEDEDSFNYANSNDYQQYQVPSKASKLIYFIPVDEIKNNISYTLAGTFYIFSNSPERSGVVLIIDIMLADWLIKIFREPVIQVYFRVNEKRAPCLIIKIIEKGHIRYHLKTKMKFKKYCGTFISRFEKEKKMKKEVSFVNSSVRDIVPFSNMHESIDDNDSDLDIIPNSQSDEEFPQYKGQQVQNLKKSKRQRSHSETVDENHNETEEELNAKRLKLESSPELFSSQEFSPCLLDFKEMDSVVVEETDLEDNGDEKQD